MNLSCVLKAVVTAFELRHLESLAVLFSNASWVLTQRQAVKATSGHRGLKSTSKCAHSSGNSQTLRDFTVNM